jgi:hypothetical protein
VKIESLLAFLTKCCLAWMNFLPSEISEFITTCFHKNQILNLEFSLIFELSNQRFFIKRIGVVEGFLVKACCEHLKMLPFGCSTKGILNFWWSVF